MNGCASSEQIPTFDIVAQNSRQTMRRTVPVVTEPSSPLHERQLYYRSQLKRKFGKSRSSAPSNRSGSSSPTSSMVLHLDMPRARSDGILNDRGIYIVKEEDVPDDERTMDTNTLNQQNSNSMIDFHKDFNKGQSKENNRNGSSSSSIGRFLKRYSPTTFGGSKINSSKTKNAFHEEKKDDMSEMQRAKEARRRRLERSASVPPPKLAHILNHSETVNTSLTDDITTLAEASLPGESYEDLAQHRQRTNPSPRTVRFQKKVDLLPSCFDDNTTSLSCKPPEESKVCRLLGVHHADE